MATPLERKLRGFRDRQQHPVRVFQAALQWLDGEDATMYEVPGGQRLEHEEAERYRQMVLALVPRGATVDGPLVLTEEMTAAWEAAPDDLRNEAIYEYGETDSFCVGGLNDFLRAIGMDPWDPSHEQVPAVRPSERPTAHADVTIARGRWLTPEREQVLNQSARVGNGGVPSIDLAGALVTVQLRAGRLEISLELDEASAAIRQDNRDETVPVRFYVTGHEVYSAD